MSNTPSRMSYSVGEAAAMIGIGRTTLYGLIKAGQLPVIKIGTRTIVRRHDIERLLEVDSNHAA